MTNLRDPFDGMCATSSQFALEVESLVCGGGPFGPR
jgi:hypothetical protein